MLKRSCKIKALVGGSIHRSNRTIATGVNNIIRGICQNHWERNPRFMGFDDGKAWLSSFISVVYSFDLVWAFSGLFPNAVNNVMSGSEHIQNDALPAVTTDELVRMRINPL